MKTILTDREYCRFSQSASVRAIQKFALFIMFLSVSNPFCKYSLHCSYVAFYLFLFILAYSIVKFSSIVIVRRFALPTSLVLQEEGSTDERDGRKELE